jgi:hypothetical protein
MKDCLQDLRLFDQFYHLEIYAPADDPYSELEEADRLAIGERLKVKGYDISSREKCLQSIKGAR